MGQLQPRLEPHPYTWKCDFHLPLKHSLVPTPNLAPATTWQTDWIFTHRDSAVPDIWSLSPPSASSYFSGLYILIKTGASQSWIHVWVSTQFWVSVDGNMALNLMQLFMQHESPKQNAESWLTINTWEGIWNFLGSSPACNRFLPSNFLFPLSNETRFKVLLRQQIWIEALSLKTFSAGQFLTATPHCWHCS